MRKTQVPGSVILSISGHKTYAMFEWYNRIERKDRVDALKELERLSSSLVEERRITGLAEAE